VNLLDVQEGQRAVRSGLLNLVVLNHRQQERAEWIRYGNASDGHWARVGMPPPRGAVCPGVGKAGRRHRDASELIQVGGVRCFQLDLRGEAFSAQGLSQHAGDVRAREPVENKLGTGF